MKVFVDLDGCLVNLVKGFCAHYRIQNPYLNPKMRGVYDFVDRSGIPNAWKPLGKRFWMNLEPMDDGFQILELIESKFDNIALLTSSCPNHGCLEGKMLWVEKHLPKYKDHLVIAKRKERCASQGILLIDDHNDNVDAFENAGGDGVLVPRLWNRHHRLKTLPYLEKVLG